MRAMHLMGNFGKDSTSGCGYMGQTRLNLSNALLLLQLSGSPSIFASKDRCIVTSSASSSSSVPYAHDLRYEYVNTLIRWDPHEYVKYVDTLGPPQRIQKASYQVLFTSIGRHACW